MFARKTTPVLALTLACLTPAAASGRAEALELSSHAARVSSLASRADYNFNCTIPRLGSSQCGNVVTVAPKQTLSVTLVSSGGKAVTFIAVEEGTGDQLRATDWIQPGAKTTKIFSAGNRAKKVRILADAEGWTTVVAKGHYSVG